MTSPRWQGVFPAITTKFHADESTLTLALSESRYWALERSRAQSQVTAAQ